MIINVTDKNLGQIKNPALRSYAGMYVSIYKDFMYRVAQTGIEIDPQDTSEQVTQKIEALRELGVTTRNDDKSLLVGEISPACVASAGTLLRPSSASAASVSLSLMSPSPATPSNTPYP